MFIVWSGLGFFVPIVGFICLLLDARIPNSWPHSVQIVAGIVVAFAGGYGLWQWGRMLNGQPGRVLVDPQTGEQVRLVKKHDLFWIPVQYWGIVLAVLGVIIAFQTPSTPATP